MKPRYEHNCDVCTFLGTHEEYDLYFCPQSGMPTVIARYGNEGANYMSGLSFAQPDVNKILYEAKLLAVKQGLLKN